MRTADLQKKLLNAIRKQLGTRDLVEVCKYFDLSTSGSKRNIQDRLESYIHKQSFAQLELFNNKVDEIINQSINGPSSVDNIVNDSARYDNDSTTFCMDTLSDSLLSQAPINLKEEVNMINRKAIVVVNFHRYIGEGTLVPMLSDERLRNIRIPNMLPQVDVQTSPFYCCSVCLHPLLLLIPKVMPNENHNNRIMSNIVFQFSISDDAWKLINRNSFELGTNKVDYKWQVLLKFVGIEPNEPLPTPGVSVAQMIPPYLDVTVNTKATPLWEILPSNCKTKEGKRHAKPVNITDKISYSLRSQNSNLQTVAVKWWQCPSVFQYYYVGVYLERKLSVREILDLFISNRHVNIRPIEDTLKLIKTKLNDPKYRSYDGDDDLVVSSVLPISLSCPVGRSRIEIPIRALACQHLQCFDAHLYLSMNERRSIWKCPVCDISATPNELFCDKYFKKILAEFKDNEDVNDINVNSDGTYVAIIKRKDEKAIPDKQADKQAPAAVDTMIVLDDSDDEEEDGELDRPSSSKERSLSNQKSSHSKKTSSHNGSQSGKERTSHSHSSRESISSDRHRHSHKSSKSKHSHDKSSSSKNKSNSVPKTTQICTQSSSGQVGEMSNLSQSTIPSLSKAIDTAISRSSVQSHTNVQPVTDIHPHNPSRTTTISNTFSVPPPLYTSPNNTTSTFSVPPPLYTSPNNSASSFSVPPPLYSSSNNTTSSFSNPPQYIASTIASRTSIPLIQPPSNLIHLTNQPQIAAYSPLSTFHHNVIPAPSAPHVPIPNMMSSIIQAPILTPMPAHLFNHMTIPSQVPSVSATYQRSNMPQFTSTNWNSISVQNKSPIVSTIQITRGMCVQTPQHVSVALSNAVPTLSVTSNKTPTQVSSVQSPSPLVDSILTSLRQSTIPLSKAPTTTINRVPVSSLTKVQFNPTIHLSNVSSPNVSVATTKPNITTSITTQINCSISPINSSRTMPASTMSQSTASAASGVHLTSSLTTITTIESPYRTIIQSNTPKPTNEPPKTPITDKIPVTKANGEIISKPDAIASTKPSAVNILSRISEVNRDATVAPKTVTNNDTGNHDLVVTNPNEGKKQLPIVSQSMTAGINIKSSLNPTVVLTPLSDLLNKVSDRPRPSTINIIRTLDDVVKTLVTDNAKPPPEPMLKNKNLITMPICCPVVIVERCTLSTARKQLTEKPTVAIQEENHSESPNVPVKSPVSSALDMNERSEVTNQPGAECHATSENAQMISIDLTSDDEDDKIVQQDKDAQCSTKTVTLRNTSHVIVTPQNVLQDIVISKNTTQDMVTSQNATQEIVISKNTPQEIVISKNTPQDIVISQNAAIDIVIPQNAAIDIVIPQNTSQGITSPQNTPQGITSPQNTPQGITSPQNTPQGITSPQNTPQGITSPQNTSQGIDSLQITSQGIDSPQITSQVIGSTKITSQGIGSPKNTAKDIVISQVTSKESVTPEITSQSSVTPQQMAQIFVTPQISLENNGTIPSLTVSNGSPTIKAIDSILASLTDSVSTINTPTVANTTQTVASKIFSSNISTATSFTRAPLVNQSSHTQSNFATARKPINVNIRWCSMKDPQFRKAFLNVGGVPRANINNKDATRIVQRPVSSTNINHYKPLHGDLARRVLTTSESNGAVTRRLAETGSGSTPNAKRLRLSCISSDELSDGELSSSSTELNQDNLGKYAGTGSLGTSIDRL